jgi:hypothetical protein
MEVVQIGDVTTGKNVGSVTLYDPLLLNRKQKPNHRYAMQPIVLKSSMQTVWDYFNGLKPTYQLKEETGNLDVLETTEPLLSTAIGKLQEQAKCQAESWERIILQMLSL